MQAFWNILPYLIKLLSAIIGSSWLTANVALSQAGGGVDFASDWWKFLVPTVIGGAGAVTSVTHHYNATKAASAEVPSGSDLEYIGRLAQAAAMRGDVKAMDQIKDLSTTLVALKPKP